MPLQKKNGFTLIEMLLVIGVLAVLMIAAFGVYRMVSSEMRATRAANEFRAMATTMVSLHSRSGQPNYWNFTQKMLLDARAVPSHAINPRNRNMTTAYGQTIHAARNSSRGSSQIARSIAYRLRGQVSERDCEKFLIKLNQVPVPGAYVWVPSGTRIVHCQAPDGQELPGWGMSEHLQRIKAFCEGGVSVMQIDVGQNPSGNQGEICTRNAQPI